MFLDRKGDILETNNQTNKPNSNNNKNSVNLSIRYHTIATKHTNNYTFPGIPYNRKGKAEVIAPARGRT